MGKRLTTEDFIKRAREAHGDKYDYSKTIYVGKDSKVVVICSEHGKFEQQANSHMRGSGCPKCKAKKLSENNKFTTKDFIKHAKEVHGDRYDYSKVNYVNSGVDVTIICSIHGGFKQKPVKHVNAKQGCSKCGGKFRYNTEEFIKRAKEVHGNKYDYSKVDYINGHKKVIIVCPEHGEFEQKPYLHLQGHKCFKCSSPNKITNINEFLMKAHEIHGDKYDYSKVDFKLMRDKIIIICSKHGEFEQQLDSHLIGRGCPKCAKNLKKTEKEFITKAHQVHGNQYDYSKAKYVNSKTKVIIICPIHGEFKQDPGNHLIGKTKCPKCQGKGLNKMTYEEAKKFIQTIGVKDVFEYREWWKKNKKYAQKIGLPNNPDTYYSKNP